MKRAITITGWQRPQLFQVMLESLAANDLSGWNVYIQLEPSEFVNEYKTAAELLSGVPVSITVNEERLGIRNNPYSVVSRAFEEGADLLVYVEEDLLLAQDATALALWYAENHRSEWMCLSFLSGGCGSKGFISDRAYPEILFASKCFNSLGFAVRREEWERNFRPAWLSDLPMYTCEGRDAYGWDWSVYSHLIMTPGLYALQPAAARATHTGRYGVYCTPEFHDSAFTGLDLSEGLAENRNYHVLSTELLPAPVRRHAALWDQTNIALRVINERIADQRTLLREQEVLYQLSILWAFRMFLGRDPEPHEYKLTSGSNNELIEKMRENAEFQSVLAELWAYNPPKLPVDIMPSAQEAAILGLCLAIRENRTIKQRPL